MKKFLMKWEDFFFYESIFTVDPSTTRSFLEFEARLGKFTPF